MDYSELAKGQHLTDAKDTIQLLMDEGYDFSEYSYDELLEIVCFDLDNSFFTLGSRWDV